MDDESRIRILQDALKRVVRVKEWCPLCNLHNVAADMAEAQKEIQKVIYSYPVNKKETP